MSRGSVATCVLLGVLATTASDVAADVSAHVDELSPIGVDNDLVVKNIPLTSPCADVAMAAHVSIENSGVTVPFVLCEGEASEGAARRFGNIPDVQQLVSAARYAALPRDLRRLAVRVCVNPSSHSLTLLALAMHHCGRTRARAHDDQLKTDYVELIAQAKPSETGLLLPSRRQPARVRVLVVFLRLG